jgi:4-hydroxybenzoate polyprenyltransferase/phosphoserine phosphatase
MSDRKILDSINVPLCVDLDGTLIYSDLLFEGVLRFLRQHPLSAWRIPLWLAKGRARLKGEIARAVQPPATSPPVNSEVLAWLEEEKSAGRKIVLVTASHEDALGPIRELFAFDEILASTDSLNLKGATKANLLCERFGEGGFDYAGDSSADAAVWEHSRKAIPVFRSRQQIAAAEQKYDCSRSFYVPPTSWVDQSKSLRIHQWVKNMLIAVPLIAGHHYHDPWQLAVFACAFLSMSLCASGTYLWNDLLDIDYDRAHPRKMRRLAASGRSSLLRILIASFILTGVGLISALILNWMFGLLMLGYIAATLSYSLYFKRVAIADIFLLTFLYLSRVVAGIIIISEAKVSFWLFGYSFLLFLSLAAAKRYVELRLIADRGDDGILGRGYIREDLPMVSSLGIATGIASCIVLSLYSNSSQVTELYQRPEWFWGICVIALFWITRIWFLTHRGLMHDDPVFFVIKDRVSWILALAGLVCILLAQPLQT